MTNETPTPPEEQSEQSERPPINWGKVANRVFQAIAHFIRILIGDGKSPLDDLKAAFGHLEPRRLLWGVAGLAIIGYLLTGVYVVDPGEAAVVRRFGAIIEPRAEPGLHYRLPWPVDREDIINVNDVRRETIGILEPEEDHVHPEAPSKLQVLSGDTNVIDIEIIVQYQVRDPAAYLLNVQYAPYRLVRDVARQAVTDLLSRQPVDAILTTERQSLQTAIRTEMQRRLDEYDSGLAVVGINLQKAFPPDEVAAAFTDVNSAREDKARAINEANGYANSIIPEARGQAQQVMAGAQAYAASSVAQANGAAQAFEAVLTEYEDNSQIYGEDVTRYRLYLETLEQVLPRAQMYVVDTANGGTVNLRLLGNPVATTD
jgi:membrane protease subunit HflK